MSSKSKTSSTRAVALEYDQELHNAPRVSAKGESAMAKEMVRIARRYGVPVVVAQQLADNLSELECDQEIDSVHFEPVARIFNDISDK